MLNPQGNLKMKCGIPPIRLLQDAGVRVGLGCDNCSCSDAQNMFVAMKLFALLAAVSEAIPGPPQSVAAIRAATEAGADGARLGHMLGRIAKGFKADLTLIDMKDPSWSPLNSVARQLVHIEAGRGVRHVIVDGKVVVKDRQLTTHRRRHDLRCSPSGDAGLQEGFCDDFGSASPSCNPGLTARTRRSWRPISISSGCRSGTDMTRA